MGVDYSGLERRSGKERRGAGPRRGGAKRFFMSLKLCDRRASFDRRGGLDRREGLARSFQKEMIIKILKRSIVKGWNPDKAKMTYLWDKGLRAVTFERFGAGQGVEVEIALPGVRNRLVLRGKVMKTKKVFTEHGFATEMDVQFIGTTDADILEINNLIWSDGEV
jgi:hypothetical protein